MTRASPRQDFLGPVPSAADNECLTAGDGPALAPLQPPVLATCRKIKQETGQRKKRVVRAPKAKLSFLTWGEDAEVRNVQMLALGPMGRAGHGGWGGTSDGLVASRRVGDISGVLVPPHGPGGISWSWSHLGVLVPSHGPGATSESWCHLGVLVPPHRLVLLARAPPVMESPQSNPCPPTPPGTVCPLPSDTALLFVTMPWLQPCHPCAPGMISRDTWGAPQPEFLFAKMDFGSLQHQENAPVAFLTQ
ncbi:hypothetical protein HGM15179_013743 [Zosterops borbonicus]|uniref:Uncharacterized protein n=1 Tax=Zosterops borbonicus TaxID=364589 RepID=A0A8K1G7G6_9PASS|nr:hypothetical protein HGM15179_013743 [Zosterops borbonicus]